MLFLAFAVAVLVAFALTEGPGARPADADRTLHSVSAISWPLRIAAASTPEAGGLTRRRFFIAARFQPRLPPGAAFLLFAMDQPVAGPRQTSL